MVFPFKLVVLSWRWRRVTLCLVIPPADLEAGPDPTTVEGRLWPNWRLENRSFSWTSRVVTGVKALPGKAFLRFSEAGRVKTVAFFDWSTGELGSWWRTCFEANYLQYRFSVKSGRFASSYACLELLDCGFVEVSTRLFWGWAFASNWLVCPCLGAPVDAVSTPPPSNVTKHHILCHSEFSYWEHAPSGVAVVGHAPHSDLLVPMCLNQNAFASSSSSSSSSFINGGCCGSSEPPEIVAASPSSAAFTGALGLAVSSVEVVARAEKVESRELFFIQRVSVRLKPSIRAGRFGDRGSGPWTSERASWKTPIEHFVFLVAPRPIFYGFARLITVVL
ncbi:hypothetical protein HID58_034523 [Brassica napus]|uniref:Secreted protein n=1 Tax=Brassica napus TaxID=3708 RepID=A0ABQ8C2B3_BRANA|nr:hypothetical protein HID58_034523 [Brassica napus]